MIIALLNSKHRGLAVTKRGGGEAVNAERLEFLINELATVY
jgi:hypothetical protein